MKLLLDESLPRDLRLHLPGHEGGTVPERGWVSKSNGELLQLASPEFDALLTADQNLEFQQNVSRYEIGVVVLVAPSNRVPDLLPLVPRVLEILPGLRPRTLVRVESPTAGENGGE
jgi:hypothetical protein